MLITLRTNNGSGKPVPNAVISFSRGGTVFNQVSFPNNTGVLYFDSVEDATLFSSGVTYRITASGYNPAGGTASSLVSGSDFTFTMKPNGLETALVVGVGVGTLLLYAATQIPKKTKRKKVGAIDVKKDVLPWLPVVAIGVAGYLGYTWYKKLFGSPEDESRAAALDADIANAAVQEPPRMSDSEIAATADQIEEDLTYFHVAGSTAVYLDAAHQLTKPGTTADLLRLIKQYGSRYITYFGIPAGKFTLEETVTRKLDPEYIDEINNYYAAQGINFKF